MRSLYYPYASPGSMTTLARAILYFDQVGFINPWQSFAVPYSDRMDPGHTIDEIDRIPLPDEAVFFVDPAKTLEKYEDVITKNILDDLRDQRFRELADSSSQKGWTLAAAKVPHRHDAIVRRFLVNLPYGSGAIFPFDSRRTSEGPFASYAETGYHEVYEEERMRGGHLEREFGEHRMVRVPFAYGESLMLNHVVSACMDSNYIPFTDDELHNRFLKLKGERFLKPKAVRQFLVDNDFLEEVRDARVADMVLAREVPDLSQIPLQDVREIRNEYDAELQRFRAEITKVSARIQSEPWSSDFEKEIRDIVASDLSPRVQELSDDLTQLAVDRIAGAGIKVLASQPLVIGASVFTGLPFPVLLLGAAGMVGMGEWLDYWRKRHRKLHNGLSFVVRVERAIKRKTRSST